MEYRWVVSRPNEAADSAAIDWAKICAIPCIASFLRCKNFACHDEVEAFLRPQLRSLPDPFLLPGMEAAVERLFRAMARGERIVLFGDYDVDGVTSLALLHEMLAAYGHAPALFLPSRMDEGYGLSPESVSRCQQMHDPQLLVAVDCGTSSAAEIARLRAAGVDVVVLDHHEPKSLLPACVALVNPKAGDAPAFRYLCSVGIVFKLCHALLKRRPLPEFDLKAHLDLVALGTVADIVPLHGDNRVLVRHGLRQLSRTSRVGLQKLMEVAGVRAPVTTQDVGFRLGPRLNAAGRLDTAERALRLLLTRDAAEAAELASFLDVQNRERQGIEAAIFAAADAAVLRESDPHRDAAIVVGEKGWHPGVLGIVASRLVRKYHRPAVVIGFDENGLGKGSGRSIEGVSMVAALGECAGRLEKFGGHEMAAGLTMRHEELPAFAAEFRAAVRSLAREEMLRPSLKLQHELTLAELNDELLVWHDRLQPFGNGNEHPVFFAAAVEPAINPRVLKEKHLLLRLRQRNARARAIYFGGAAEPLPPPPWDVAFRIEASEFNGERRIDLHVQAVRTAAAFD